MAYILFYADEKDFKVIHKHLNDHSEVAFIVPDGKNRWRSAQTVPRLKRGSVTLWHVPSGPLPLLHPPNGQKATRIRDPWKGWKQLHPPNSREPFFGDPPGIITMEVQPQARYAKGGVGMSAFGWIGNYYSMVGFRAKKATEAFWKDLRRWVKENATLIPRKGRVDGPRREIWAFASALASFKLGRPRDEDWW